nr:MAG TPA: hypothetical protein [Caudoviricetes sp.]
MSQARQYGRQCQCYQSFFLFHALTSSAMALAMARQMLHLVCFHWAKSASLEIKNGSKMMPPDWA